jgi:hypothetical protein
MTALRRVDSTPVALVVVWVVFTALFALVVHIDSLLTRIVFGAMLGGVLAIGFAQWWVKAYGRNADWEGTRVGSVVSALVFGAFLAASVFSIPVLVIEVFGLRWSLGWTLGIAAVWAAVTTRLLVLHRRAWREP